MISMFMSATESEFLSLTGSDDVGQRIVGGGGGRMEPDGGFIPASYSLGGAVGS